jgi:hypothetical protein
MSYGFKLLNSSGKLIANSEDFNYGLVAEGTATSTGGWVTISYSDTGEIPMVFIKFASITESLARYIAVQAISSTQVAFGIFNTSSGNGRLSHITGSVDYRIYKTFKSLGDVSGDPWGIKIFNASGEKTFDSRYKIPLVTNQVVLPAVGAPSNNSIPYSSVILPGGIAAPLWVSVNSVAGHKGFQYNGFLSPQVALCYGAVGISYDGTNTVLIGSYGHQPAGGPSGQITWDSGKQIFLAKN